MFNLAEGFCVEPFTLPSLQVDLCDAITISNLRRSTIPAEDSRRKQLSIVPGYIHYESAASAESFDRASGPRGWKRGQKFYLSVLGLQEHLSDSGCACGISIDRKDILFGSGDTATRKCEKV